MFEQASVADVLHVALTGTLTLHVAETLILQTLTVTPGPTRPLTLMAAPT